MRDDPRNNHARDPTHETRERFQAIPFGLVMALLTIFPEIALWLPKWHYGR